MVLHLRYSVLPETPWRGDGPLQVAALAGRLSAETLAVLADESGMPRGAFLPISHTGGEDANLESLKSDVRDAKGRILTVDGGNLATGERERDQWMVKRFGANPPDPLVRLLERASMEVYAACGLSPALFMQSDRTGAREAWWQALFGVIAPLGVIVQGELGLELAESISLAWDELRASDLQGRARAFQSMVGGGMEPGVGGCALRPHGGGCVGCDPRGCFPK